MKRESRPARQGDGEFAGSAARRSSSACHSRKVRVSPLSSPSLAPQTGRKSKSTTSMVIFPHPPFAPGAASTFRSITNGVLAGSRTLTVSIKSVLAG